ncbi:MAG TPA: endonuclease/exonuclease/phosphatase family protein, partial [Candidatus Sulfotelmatobacter sp.]|nr:endonuclease/exonuclease/phosphatase family protein [Candidatus Sulfotelmatobacter sp.]
AGSAATTPANNKDRTFSVMTRNMDAGSDFGYVMKVALNPDATQLDILLAVSNTYAEMLASNIPGRAQAIAHEIQTTLPSVIGMQEITALRTGPYGQAPDTVVVDGLKSLLDALEEQGVHYKAIAVQTNASVDLPAFDASGNLVMVGLTDYDAVLARTDLPVSELKISNIAMQHFGVVLPFSVAGQTIPFLRGWISMDVKERGKSYKFVTTHLETFNSDIQAAQANELINGPLISDLPVVLAGDMNSDASQQSWENGPAILILQAAGFSDIWSQLRPSIPGLTWPLFAEDPPGSATPYQRIDLILTRGDGLRNSNIALTGLTPFNGVMGSDHAGVLGEFVLLP